MMVAQLYKFTKNSVVQWLNLWYVSYSFKNQGLSPPPLKESPMFYPVRKNVSKFVVYMSS